MKRIEIDKQQLINLYLIEKKNLSETAAILGLHPVTLKKKLVKAGIPIRNTSGYRRPPCKILKEDEEAINGALLGDGTLTLSKGKTSANFRYASKSFQHTFFVWQKLQRFVAESNAESLSKVSQYDKRTNKTYSRYFFSTISDTTFLALRHKWYPNGKKVVPSDIRLTPLTCLIWYIGDGFLCKASGNLFLCTNGFKREDIEKFLIPQLSKYEARAAHKTKEQYMIIIPRRKAVKFLKFIGPCPFDEYANKWKDVPYKRKFHNLSC